MPGPLSSHSAWGRSDGTPAPQGATWVEEDGAYNFALYSKHAERVVLLLYGADDLVHPVLSKPLDPPRHKTGRIWHCRVPLRQALGACYYALQVDGHAPSALEPWNRFDPEKVLFDPYARALHLPQPVDMAAAAGPGPSAGRVPVGILDREADAVTPGREPAPARHEADAVVYELHVRGFTKTAEDVPPDERGTFRGLIRRVPYLRELGVTIVELMPVFQHDPVADYWGYMPLSFFALHSGYARAGEGVAGRREFIELVDALHGAGIEVVLDVVYNHTAEGGERGPTLSLKGIDNSTFYLMSGAPPYGYVNLSGTGNTIHAGNRYVRKMIADSLRYWTEEMGVDGFRFDLASVFARDEEGRVREGDRGLVGDIVSDPVLGRLRLIAEPWDAVGTQLLGRGLPGIPWAQWNSRFQEDVRRFVRGDAGMVGPLLTRLYGSDDLFPDDRDNAYRPWQSLNYVTSHDGFTLYDLVSYETKRNQANGHGNRDGSDNNLSWNCGWEGDAGVPGDVLRLRERQARNLVALLLLSNGTPMIRAGDEFLHTQGGNNNPYNQDNATSWLDWSRLDEHAGFHRFARLMIAFRKAHPSLCRNAFWRGDVRWYGPAGSPDYGPDSRTVAFWLGGRGVGDTDLYVMINGGASEVAFTIQEGAPDRWARVVDTAREPPDDIVEPGSESPLTSARYVLGPRSVVVLVRRVDRVDGSPQGGASP